MLLRVDPREATLVVTRAKAAEFEHLASLCRKERPDMRVLYLAQGVGPGGYCSPRHWEPSNSRNKCSKCIR